MALRRKTNKLREARKACGFSGYDLQILSRIPAQEIYRIERGLKRPKAYECDLLAQALDMPIDEIFPRHLEGNSEIEGDISRWKKGAF